MILTYYPDTDTLDVDFREVPEDDTPTYDTLQDAREAARQITQPASENGETETYDADPAGQTRAHYRNDRLEDLTIEHASRRAPESWDISSLRKEAARVAVTTGRIVESVTYDLGRNRTSFQTGDLVQLQLVRCAIELWTDLVRPYLKLELGAIANCFPLKIV
ncbi:MAG: hypothetical protein BRD55_05735 [Bacteroidetes bacterium SW_9_63_38]|nr:MAG: hypothetical protein BRD55_05735 [Bacteroidetes bacterium SW_9_63_38]